MVIKPPGEIDPNMRLLIDVLNNDLKIRTYESCGGHTNPSGRISARPKGEFYVSFANLVVTKEQLNLVRAAISKHNGNIHLEDHHCYWTISGKGVIPDEFAGTLQYMSSIHA